MRRKKIHFPTCDLELDLEKPRQSVTSDRTLCNFFAWLYGGKG